MEISIKLGGLFLGVLIRTWLPFFRKMKQGKISRFEYKYLHQALGSTIIALVAVLLILPRFQAEPPAVLTTVEAIKYFATAFAFGFGSNSLINELLEWKEEKNEN